MDIQTRKLEFIQEFLKIQSEEIISRLERILKNIDDDFSPLTIEEFNSRIDQSLEDSKNDKVIEQFRKDISLGRTFEETELYQLIEDSEEKIVVNRLNNILRDKPAHQNKFDFQEYKTGAWSEFNDYKLAVRFSNAKTELSEKHFEKTGEYMTSRGIAKLTGFNPANIKNMLQHKRAVVKKMLITLEKLAKEY